MLARVLPVFVLSLFSLLLAVWILTFGMQLFSGMDGGVLINAAWQELHGAVPYRDFSTGAPPLFLLPAGWAFQWWGPSWLSLVKMTCLFSVATFLWLFGILWEGTRSLGQTILFAMIVQMIVVMPSCWWWYNELTWMGCVIFFASALSLLGRPQSAPFSRLSFFLSAAALALLKPNLGGFVLVLVGLLFFFDRRLRGFVICTGIFAVALDTSFLALNHISIADVLANYRAVSGRANFQMFSYLLVGPDEEDYRLQMLAPALLGMGLFIVISKHAWADPILKKNFLAMLAIALFAAIDGMIMNYQRKALCASCLVIMLPFVHLHVRSSSGAIVEYAKRAGLVFALLLGLMGCYVGGTRQQFKYFGLKSYNVRNVRCWISEPPLFAGMRVSYVFAGTLVDMKSALAASGVLSRSGKSVFFGPNVDFAYAAFDLPAPKGFPLWWEMVPSSHRGEKYPFDHHLPSFANNPSRWLLPGEPLDPQVQLFLKTKFDVCVFLNSEGDTPIMSYLPGDIRADIYENYDLHRYNHISAFVRRPSASGPVGPGG